MSSRQNSTSDVRSFLHRVGISLLSCKCRPSLLPWQNGSVIGYLPSSFLPTKLNNSNEVIGSLATTSQGTIWVNGSLMVLSPLPRYSYSALEGLNNLGQIVGASISFNGAPEPTIWNGGVASALGLAPGFNQGNGNDINGSGQVVADQTGGLGEFAFLWQNGMSTSLGTLPGYSGSVASSINGLGQIVGWASKSQIDQAVIWQGGTITVLPGCGGERSVRN